MGKRKKGKKKEINAGEILKNAKGYYLINPAYPEELAFWLIGMGKLRSLAAVRGKPEDFPDGKVFRYIER